LSLLLVVVVVVVLRSFNQYYRTIND